MKTTNQIRRFRFGFSLLMSLCVLLTCLQTARALTTLFSDDFTGQSGAPTNWYYGNNQVNQTVGTGDTFAVNSNSTALRHTDVAPFGTYSVPIIFHSVPACNFKATGAKVLQLSCDVTVGSNAPDYRIGLFDSTTSAYITHCNYVALRIFPSLSSNNVSIITSNSTSTVVTNTSFSTAQANLTGTHHLTLQIDYTVSTLTPTIRAYINGTFIGQVLTTANEGIHPAASGPTQATAIRVMAQCMSAASSGGNFALDNVKVTADSPVLLNGNLETWTGVTGTPPTGTPSSWGGSPSTVVRAPGLVTGSSYSCIINNAQPYWQGIYANNPSSYVVSQVLAINASTATAPMLFSILQMGPGNNFSTRHSFITARFTQGSASGKFTLQVQNGGSWQTLVTDAVDASTYVSASNSFTTLNAYNLIIAYNSATNTYALSIGKVGGKLITKSNLAYFAEANNGQPLALLYYYGGGAANSFAIDNVSIEALASVQPTATNLLDRGFLGFGAEWDTYSYPSLGINATDLALIQSRVTWMKTPIVRIDMQAAYCYLGSGTYNWNTASMSSLYSVLDYCQANNITVVLTEWGAKCSWITTPDVNRCDDAIYATIIGTYMDYLINTKGYSCIKYFIFQNEPENYIPTYTPSILNWLQGYANVYAELESRGLLNQVSMSGPDQSGSTTHLPLCLSNSALFDGYDLHYYAPINPSASVSALLTSPDIRTFFKTAWNQVRQSDPDTTKPLIVAEAGFWGTNPNNGQTTGSLNNPFVNDWEFGYNMAYYAYQAVNAGSHSVIAWALDDNEYATSTFGMWSSKATGFVTRPWFYTWALLSRSFPAGATFTQIDAPVSTVKILAASYPSGGVTKWSFMVINTGSTPATFALQVPNATNFSAARYLYGQNDRTVDANSLPTPLETYTAVLNSGVTLTFPAQTVTFLCPP